mgnify:CR=1 FL=1
MLKIAFDPIYKHQLKTGHRFPMEKYELLPEDLLRKSICNRDNFFAPEPIEKQLLLSITLSSETALADVLSIRLDNTELATITSPASGSLSCTTSS